MQRHVAGERERAWERPGRGSEQCRLDGRAQRDLLLRPDVRQPDRPGGDDGGYIPSTPEHYKCSLAVAKLWYRLDGYVSKCHTKLAASVWANKPFDEEACEEVGDYSALGKYNAGVGKYIQAGICPPCLANPPGALGLGTSTVSDADANLQEVYICPGP